MRIRLSFLIILSFLLQGINYSQNINDKVLMTVDGQNYTAGEFIRMYKKSYDPKNTKDLDTYLDKYVFFRYKVADMIRQRHLRLNFKDTGTSYLRIISPTTMSGKNF